MREEQINQAVEGLATLARIPTLWEGIATFQLDAYLRGPKWYEPKDWATRGYLDQVAVPVPVVTDDAEWADERCRLALRHGLESLALELRRMKRLDPEGSFMPRPRYAELLTTAERYIDAMGKPFAARAEQAAA